MKKTLALLAALLVTSLGSTLHAEPLLQHVVSFKFKKDAAPADIKKVETAFAALKEKIPQIKALQWGTNNSPEKLNKDFTHCFIVTFASEKDREIYLPHPDHQAFVQILKPTLDDVFVIDFWTQK
jgi:hypothetical protein